MEGNTSGGGHVFHASKWRSRRGRNKRRVPPRRRRLGHPSTTQRSKAPVVAGHAVGGAADASTASGSAAATSCGTCTSQHSGAPRLHATGAPPPHNSAGGSERSSGSGVRVRRIPATCRIVDVQLRSSTFASWHEYLVRTTTVFGSGTVWRRFCQFDCLKNLLVAQFPGTQFPPFPAKVWFGSQADSVVQHRRRALQAFVGFCLRAPAVSQSPLVARFLGLDRLWARAAARCVDLAARVLSYYPASSLPGVRPGAGGAECPPFQHVLAGARQAGVPASDPLYVSVQRMELRVQQHQHQHPHQHQQHHRRGLRSGCHTPRPGYAAHAGRTKQFRPLSRAHTAVLGHGVDAAARFGHPTSDSTALSDGAGGDGGGGGDMRRRQDGAWHRNGENVGGGGGGGRRRDVGVGLGLAHRGATPVAVESSTPESTHGLLRLEALLVQSFQGAMEAQHLHTVGSSGSGVSFAPSPSASGASSSPGLWNASPSHFVVHAVPATSPALATHAVPATSPALATPPFSSTASSGAAPDGPRVCSSSSQPRSSRHPTMTGYATAFGGGGEPVVARGGWRPRELPRERSMVAHTPPSPPTRVTPPTSATSPAAASRARSEPWARVPPTTPQRRRHHQAIASPPRSARRARRGTGTGTGTGTGQRTPRAPPRRAFSDAFVTPPWPFGIVLDEETPDAW